MCKTKIKGLNVCNPVDVKKDYLLHAVDYAKENGFNHIQINGPIHNPVKGNIDGITLYRKYSRFNGEKDETYLKNALDAVNAACEQAKHYGIKMYLWHHELELPGNFGAVYPECLNSYGDIEVTHPLVRDFLENKLADFFASYPKMDGIILTLHETRIPLLKLRDQKLGKLERVKYVTEILFQTCNALGKELIVRPFASVEDDYEMLMSAYENISDKLLVMDKWTQFDWSLTLPGNAFFSKIRNNPLLVEGDIYGEFFGMGYYPLMLKEHLKQRFEYCGRFTPEGYVLRIDRAGDCLFGDVNEVNLAIVKAYMNGRSADDAIRNFFEKKYPQAAEELLRLMEETEQVVIKIIYLNGYYFNEQSFFPSLNHCKNHYYFELMRENYNIDSNEWFIPKIYQRGSTESLLKEKEQAVQCAADLFFKLQSLKSKMEPGQYQQLWIQFANLKAAAQIWESLAKILKNYISYFETRNEKYITLFEDECVQLLHKKNEAIDLLGENFIGLKSPSVAENEPQFDYIEQFADEVRNSFYREKQELEVHSCDTELIDFVICGGAAEGHKLQKEVNFSDTLLNEHGLCRLAGSSRGTQWCTVNAHGWFSYLLRIKPNAKNVIKISAGSLGDGLGMEVKIAGLCRRIHEPTNDVKEFTFTYEETKGENMVRIGFYKISGNTPCVYTIRIY